MAELVGGLRREFGPFAYDRIDRYHPLAALQQNMERLRSRPVEQIGPFRVASVTLVDGIKFYFEEGSWMLMRVSDTEPLGRIYAGSDQQSKVQRLLDEGQSLLMK